MLRCFLRTVIAMRSNNFAFASAKHLPPGKNTGASPHRRSWIAYIWVSAVLCGLALCYSALVFADDESESATESSTLQLESEVYVPNDLWPTQPLMEAPSVAVAPPEPLTPPPLEPVNIMLDWFLSPQHAVILLAHEKGFFQQQRLKVSWQIPGDPSLPTKLLAAGEIDLALGRQTQLHLAAHDGAPLTRIASLVKTPLNAIVTINKGEDADLEALGSKPLGFATQEGQQLVLPLLISETVRQSEHYAKPRAVHFETAESLNEGELEAVADAFFHTLPSRLATQGQSATVIRYDALSIPRYDGLIVMANRNTVGRRMETWVRFVVALEEAANWIIEHPDEALEMVTAAYPRLENSLTNDHWQDLLRRLALSPAALDIRRYRVMEAFLHQRGITSEILPVEQLAIDPHLGQ